jgi:hypothetical protein
MRAAYCEKAFERTKPLAGPWPEIRSTKLEMRNKLTADPRKSAVQFEKTIYPQGKPIARRWREIRSTKLEMRNKLTADPRKSAQSAVQFEKTKPICRIIDTTRAITMVYGDFGGWMRPTNKAKFILLHCPNEAGRRCRQEIFAGLACRKG